MKPAFQEAHQFIRLHLWRSFNNSLINMLLMKLQIANRPISLLLDYLIFKTLKIQATVRMKFQRRRYLLLKAQLQLFLCSGPARLTHNSKVRGSRLENTRMTTWLILKPPSIKFWIYSYEKKDKRTWSTTVSLSEIKILKTKHRETLTRRALAESMNYLSSLSSLF